LAPLAAALATSALAQTQQLQAVVVTATRQPQALDDTISDVTVIDRAQLEAQGTRTLSEVLARVPGIQHSANGGPGEASSLFIRGAEARHTLLLIDGVPYGSATLGTPVWETLPLAQIERIEILRGPAAALYGSSALGGVVQIFTRQGAPGFTPNAAVRLGSEHTDEVTAGFAAGQGPWTYSLQGQHLHTDGFSATNSKVPFGNFNPDDDGFRQASLSGRARFKLDEHWSLNTGLMLSDGLVHFDDGPGRDSRATQRAEQLSTSLEGRVREGWSSTLRVAGNTDTSHAVEAAFLPSNFQTHTLQWLWQNDVTTPLGTLLAGAESVRQSVDSSTAYAVTQRTIRSLLLGLSGQSGAHHWQANVRRDDNSQFGGATTGALGYGFDLSPAWRVTASRGSSFVAPSFNQLYFPGFGNPSLQPERGLSSEVGLRWNGASQSAKLTAFDNRIRGFFDPANPMAVISRAHIEGQSLAWEARWNSSTTLNAGLDLMRPRNESNHHHLPRRADRQLTLAANQRLGAFDGGASLLAVGERFDDSANTPAKRMPGYATLDLLANYHWRPEWTLEARVNNVAGRVFETAFGYNQPGRQVFVGLRFAPKS
jgi:vitamin B12 transporter